LVDGEVGVVANDDYELLPKEELDYLRHEVEKLKRNPLGDTQASISLLDAMNKLSLNIMKMNEVFASANDDLVRQFNDASLQEQLRKMQDQQEKLARGIVAVADMVKKLEETRGAPFPSIDQMLPKTPSSSPASSAPSMLAPPIAPVVSAPIPVADAPARARNPFEQGYDPILREPLPHPAHSSQMPSASSASRIVPGQIPDDEVPPPPPKRF
jgi:hypothetical protein